MARSRRRYFSRPSHSSQCRSPRNSTPGQVSTACFDGGPLHLPPGVGGPLRQTGPPVRADRAAAWDSLFLIRRAVDARRRFLAGKDFTSRRGGKMLAAYQVQCTPPRGLLSSCLSSVWIRNLRYIARRASGVSRLHWSSLGAGKPYLVKLALIARASSLGTWRRPPKKGESNLSSGSPRL
jgi:hypothetical protein